MMKIKFYSGVVLALVLLLGTAGLVNASTIKLAPGSTTVTKDREFTIDIQLNTENKPTFGADVVLLYPGRDIEVGTVTNAGFFSDMNFANDIAGKLEIHAFFAQPTENKAGEGSIAKVKFRIKTDTGDGYVSFVCSGDGNNTQVIDSAGQNTLSCNSLSSIQLTFTGNTVTAIAGPTIKPTTKATARPRATATAQPKGGDLTATQEPIALIDETQPTPEPSLFEEPLQAGGGTSNIVRTIGIGIVGFLITLFIIYLATRLARRKDIDQINPPENPPPTQI